MSRRASGHGDFLTRQQHRLRNVRRRVVGWLAVPLVWTLCRLPLAIVRPTAKVVVGWTMYLFNRETALVNLGHSFGDALSIAERRRIARRCCLNMATSLAETMIASHRGAAVLAGRLDDAEAREKIAAFELEHPEGFIGVTGHIGNWELLAFWTQMVSRSERPMVVAKRMANPHLNKIVEGLRAGLQLETLYQSDSPTPAIRALRRGNVVGIAPDQDIKTISGVFIEFLGRPAYTPVGPARIAIASRSPLMCIFMVRDGKRLKVIVNEPIHPDKSLPRNEQIVAMTTAWSAQIEAMVRAYPDQWPWIHERWKTTPERLAKRGRRKREAAPVAPEARAS